jgi:hypothetical protein
MTTHLFVDSYTSLLITDIETDEAYLCVDENSVKY